MDDEPADWLSESTEAEPAPEEAAPAAVSPTGGSKPGSKQGSKPGTPPEDVPKPHPALAAFRARMALEPVDEDLLKLLQVEEPKKQINKHWARPRFLQYDYLYHYRHNYYDDYIDFLDRRMGGYEAEVPRPQTWAERALRTYTRNTYPHSITYNIPVPKQKDFTYRGRQPSGYAPPHRLSYFKSATSTLVSTDTLTNSSIPVPKQKDLTYRGRQPSGYAPSHSLSYFKSAKSTLVSTDTRLITNSRLYETKPPKPESALLYTPHWANTWHSVHSKDYYNRRYKAILF